MGELTFEQRSKEIKNKQISGELCSFMAEDKRKGTRVRADMAHGRDSREDRKKGEKVKGVIGRLSTSKTGCLILNYT